MKKVLVIAVVLVACVVVWAAEVKEHPLIRPYPDSVLAQNMSKYRKFDQHEFYVMNENTKKREKKPVRGEYWRLLYEVRKPDGSRVTDISKLEFLENYRMAAEEKGGQVIYEDSTMITFTLPREDGGITYCQVSGNAGLGQQDLVIVDEKPFKKSLVFGPAEMKEALDKEGRVRLYGILFDLDKATLKAESTRQLQHVITLLLQNPDLVLEVQGHTDNQGEDDYNLELSQRRAETVTTYLTLFGVAPQRLTSKGYGETSPVDTNDTEEGRAKNRRVELVEKQATAASSEPEAAESSSDGDIRSYRAAIKMEGLSAMGGTATKMTGQGTIEAVQKPDATAYRVELEQKIDMGGQKMTMPMLTVFDGKDVFVETSVMGRKMAVKMAPDQPSTVIVSDKDEMLAKMKDVFEMKALPDEQVNGKAAHVYELVPKQAASPGPGAAPSFTRGKICFAKDNNLPLRWVMFDNSDKPLMTIDYTDYEINVNIDAARFTYTPPPGVAVMDAAAARMGR